MSFVQAQAPSDAVLRGRVLDSSSGAVPATLVSVETSDGRQASSALSDSQGSFRFRLPPDTYNLRVAKEGFAESRREGIVLRAGQGVTVDLVMGIAPMAERLTVTAKAPPLESVPETETMNFQEVLEIREVRESSARDAGEALGKLDGLWKIRKGGIASDTVLRGYQQDNLNVLIDGQRIYGACPNNMDPPAFHVDFSEVRHVEVTKGPFDLRNQGSLGGAINIVSKNPEPGLRFTPSLATGSFGYWNPSVTASLSGERHHGLAGYAFRRSDPYRDGDGKPFTSYANYRPQADSRHAFDIRTAWFKFGAATWNKQRIDLSFTRQDGGEALYPYLLMDAVYDDADRWGIGYSWQHPAGGLREIRLRGYFTRVKHWMTDEQRLSSAGAARPYGMATFADTRALGGQVEADWGYFTGGFEAYRRGWDAVNTMRMAGAYVDQHSIPGVNTVALGAYGIHRMTLFDKLRLTAGARLDRAESRAESQSVTSLYWAYQGTTDLAATDIHPSASLWIAYPLRDGLDVFAGAGHTVRFPDPQERYFSLKRMGSDWVGNPALRPVRNTEADLGLAYRGRWFTLRPTVFYSRLEDFITIHNRPRINMTPGVMNVAARSYENVEARIYGGEAGYSVGLTQAVLIAGGVSYARGRKSVNPAYGISDPDLAEMPPLKARLAVRYGNRRFFGEVEGLASNAQSRVDSDLKEARTPGHGVINVKAGLHTRKLNLAAGMDNVFNRSYWEYLSFQRDPFRSGIRVPEPGRSVYVNVSYAF
jgi:iron complex outermembrane receptor protein